MDVCDVCGGGWWLGPKKIGRKLSALGPWPCGLFFFFCCAVLWWGLKYYRPVGRSPPSLATPLGPPARWWG